MLGETMLGETMLGEAMLGETMFRESLLGETMLGGTMLGIELGKLALKLVLRTSTDVGSGAARIGRAHV